METSKTKFQRTSNLDRHLGYWLRRVSNAVSGAFTRALQEKQTSVAEWVLLCELHERGQAASGELADLSGLTRGAVSKIVDKLEAKGWIRACAKEGDSRFRLLSLTRDGRRNLPVLAKVADTNDARFFDCLAPAEKNTLRALLTKIADHNRIHDVPTR
ncbi:MAG TPA: MarR family transcriptional regulator [Edaphobacter sp.]|jgi:DNA-binding MarR family transcriptional regulator|nr:MarR family transcriptional regulator [Edaphobacter sp.]